MKYTKKKKLLSFFLIFTLCFGLLTPTFRTEAARATGTVKNRILNVRSSASTSSSIICKLSQGTKVSIISETTGDDGLKWYDVFFAYGGDAKEGYIRADLLNVSGSVSGSSGSASNNSSGSDNSGSSASGQKYVKPAVAIIRTYASTNADIRTKLERGTAASVISSKKGDDGRTWYKISFTKNGSAMEGYIRGDLLIDTNPGGSASSTDVSGTRYVVPDSGVSVRSYASTNGDIRSKLNKGTAVSLITSKKGDDGQTWYKVSYTVDGYKLSGYIRSDLLTDKNPAGDSGSSNTSSGSASTSVTIRPAVANIRSYASTGADIRSKLPAGTTATIISEKTGNDGKKWYKISYTLNGNTMQGYIRSDLVTMGAATNTSGSSGNSSSGSSSGGVAQVRSYASPNADIRATLENGTKVAVIKEKTGDDGQKWTKISFTQNGEKIEGYVPSSLLK